jgi:hypothetical protein
MRTMTLLLLGATFAFASEHREFDDIVDAISSHYRSEPKRLPFSGLINTVAFFVRPAGAKHLDLAVFEDLRGPMEPNVIRNLVGDDWKPFVQVYARRPENETTLIYMRPEGRDTRLLITTLERREATVVQLRLNLDALRRWFDDPKTSAHDH